MIHILTTSYNCSNYIPNCIHSLQIQTVKDWICWILDDISTDGSPDVVKFLTDGDDRFELIENEKKLYQPGNYYHTMKRPEIGDQDIVLTLDGDDTLSSPTVLEKILNVYRDPNIWITYGSFLTINENGQMSAGSCGLPPDKDNFRHFSSWPYSHLRTWKAWLFRKIMFEDLLAPDGNFWSCAGDCAFMLPMLEMAKNGHWKFISECLYLYNAANPLCDFRTQLRRSIEYTELIKKMIPYHPL